ncbi:MAG: tetratricopeptide repeat protein [Bacteroides sp.]|nr:tetratricopeptide repeat protein [Ruminococcus flavefaciens]MCM1554237.1 tetratricopeptide repeat protein [Bacteroides sp.]
MKWLALCLFGCVLAGFSPVCAQEKGSLQNRLQLAGRFMENGERDKALSLYEELYKEDPQTFVYREYVKCLQELDQYAQAEKIIRKQMRSAPHPAVLRVDLAANFIKAGQNKKAEAVFNEILQKNEFIDGGLSPKELTQAIVQQTGRHDVAVAVYQKARLIECGSPDNLPCYALYAESLAELYRQSGQIEPMLDEYLLLMSQDPSESAKVYARLQGLLAGEDGSHRKRAETIKRALVRKIQQQADNPLTQDLLIWVLLQEKDFETALLQARAYSRRFADGGAKWLEAIRTVAKNDRFEEASAQYEAFLQAAGDPSLRISPQNTRNARIELLNLYFAQLEAQGGKDLDKARELKQSYQKLLGELGRDPETFGMYRNLAKIHAYYLNEKDSAQRWVEKALNTGRFSSQQKAQLKIDLADILLYYNKVWDATLLYGQVEKDFKQDPIGFYAKLQNARLSYYIGEFEWAKSQLDVLRAATAKLIANDAMELSLLIRENMNPDSAYDGLTLVARSDFLVFRHLYEPALELLDEVLQMPLEGALFDEVYYRKAHIFLAMDSTDRALEYLQKVYDYPDDDLLADDALFEAAEIHREQGDTAQAMELYQRLFLDFKSSSLAPLARQRYRELRGDR